MTIVITLPEFVADEALRITRLLESGRADRVHIRKPSASSSEVEGLLRLIPQHLYPRLSMHDFHELALQYHLGGIHLTGRHPHLPEEWRGLVSTSCHSLEELARRRGEGRFDYLSLSPIFDSVSKVGYLSAFTTDDIASARRHGLIDARVLALGGVTFARLPEVLSMGFGGGMILGDAWRSAEP